MILNHFVLILFSSYVPKTNSQPFILIHLTPFSEFCVFVMQLCGIWEVKTQR